jgi:hypothetical protein
VLRAETPTFEVLVDLLEEPFFRYGEVRKLRVTVRNCFEMKQQEWARITLHAPAGVELQCAQQVLQPLNNLWGACAQAEFAFTADQYPGAKLELLVDVQLEGRHSYGVVKVVLARK